MRPLTGATLPHVRMDAKAHGREVADARPNRRGMCQDPARRSGAQRKSAPSHGHAGRNPGTRRAERVRRAGCASLWSPGSICLTPLKPSFASSRYRIPTPGFPTGGFICATVCPIQPLRKARVAGKEGSSVLLRRIIKSCSAASENGAFRSMDRTSESEPRYSRLFSFSLCVPAAFRS